MLDGTIVEEGTVIRSYTPGLVNSPAVIEGGGVQIDGLQGGILRLRGSSGGLRDVIELGANGLVFGGTSDTANLYSPSANTLKTDDSLFAADLRHDSQLNFVVGGATGAAVISDGLYLPSSKAVIFEGATSDANEISLVGADATADRTITLPDATGTVALTSQIPSITGTTFDLTGDVSMTAAALTIGAANSYSVAVTDDSHNHTGATLSGIALGTDTTGNYVATITSANSLITVSGSGAEGAAVTITGDLTPTFTSVTTTSLNVSGVADFTNDVDLGNDSTDEIKATSLYGTTDITNSQTLRIYTVGNTSPSRIQWRIFRETSSERFKVNITPMPDSEEILEIQPSSYYDKAQYETSPSTAALSYGLIAEQMEENPIGSKFVSHNEDGLPETVQYDKLVVPLLSAMRALRTRIEELEAKVAELETGA